MSFAKTIAAFLRLVRFEHALLFSFSVMIAEIVCSGGSLTITPIILISLLVPIFSEMGAFAMNDLIDIKTDTLNKKHGRPLVTGELTPSFARWTTAVSFILAIAISYFISAPVFVLTLMLCFLAALYNLYLKDLPLFGNMYIAFTMGIPFIFGNLVVGGPINPINVVVAVMGFTVGLAREIVKSVEDIKGDKAARKSKTLPIVIGSEKSLTIAGILYVSFVILSVVPYYTYLAMGTGFIFVLVADLAFLYSALVLIFSRRKNAQLPFLRKLSMLALFVGLVGILLSVLHF